MTHRIGGAVLDPAQPHRQDVWPRDLLANVGKIRVASVVMGAVDWLSSHGITSVLGLTRWGRVTDLAISIPLGLLVFYSMCRVLKVEELGVATRALAGPVLRRWRGSTGE